MFGLFKKLIKRYVRDFWWYFYGKSFKNPNLPINPGSFLFICKGNICRSPFAEHYARKLCEEEALLNVKQQSSGLQVTRPEGSPANAVAVAQLSGVDLSNHVSQKLDLKMVLDADVIVAMEASHIKTLKELYPNLIPKLFLLPLFEKKDFWGKGYLKYNIPDPYGKDKDAYQVCYRRIASALEKMLFVCNR